MPERLSLPENRALSVFLSAAELKDTGGTTVASGSGRGTWKRREAVRTSAGRWKKATQAF